MVSAWRRIMSLWWYGFKSPCFVFFVQRLSPSRDRHVVRMFFQIKFKLIYLQPFSISVWYLRPAPNFCFFVKLRFGGVRSVSLRNDTSSELLKALVGTIPISEAYVLSNVSSMQNFWSGLQIPSCSRRPLQWLRASCGATDARQRRHWKLKLWQWQLNNVCYNDRCRG